MWFYHTTLHRKDVEGMANSVDLEGAVWSGSALFAEQSDLGQHCLPRPICPKIWYHYGICRKWNAICAATNFYMLFCWRHITCLKQKKSRVLNFSSKCLGFEQNAKLPFPEIIIRCSLSLPTIKEVIKFTQQDVISNINIGQKYDGWKDKTW